MQRIAEVKNSRGLAKGFGKFKERILGLVKICFVLLTSFSKKVHRPGSYFPSLLPYLANEVIDHGPEFKNVSENNYLLNVMWNVAKGEKGHIEALGRLVKTLNLIDDIAVSGNGKI